MIFDTNLIIHHVREKKRLPGQAVIPMVVVGELKAFTHHRQRFQPPTALWLTFGELLVTNP
jgi:hypothetical protein